MSSQTTHLDTTTGLDTGGTGPAPPRKRSLMDWLGDHPGLGRLLVIATLLLLWEFFARAFGDPLFVASPVQVLFAVKPLLATAGIKQALVVTASELALAFALSAIFGIVVGTWLGLSRFADRSFMPIVLLLYATPQVTIIPLFMMVFGIGPASKVAYGFSHGIFPIIVTVAAGVRNINPLLLISTNAMGANGAQILQHVVFHI
jgi:ABC-type nitrate/sulfonate/bicarbonate transport system permease component